MHEVNPAHALDNVRQAFVDPGRQLGRVTLHWNKPSNAGRQLLSEAGAQRAL
jgi:hypothetical protein